MEHYGKTLKQLRISRNMSQQEVCAEIMSRSNLSRFENQEYIPGFDKVIQLLANLGVEMDEFMYINNNYHISHYERLYEQLIHAENRRNHSELIETAAKIAVEKGTNRGFYELYLLSQMALLENKLPAAVTIPQISDEMRTVLLDTENWLFADFRRLNNFLRIFNLEEAVFLYRRAVKEFEKYEAFPRENNIRIYLALNLGQMLAEHGQQAQAVTYFDQAKEYADRKNKLFQKLTIEASLERVVQASAETKNSKGFKELLVVLSEMGYTDTVTALRRYQE
ncbi:Rgg/GadR/MutR family transcriptional regulator [Enterococcus sp. BWR-S5]|uniref:Rgg/GadR/MutR family transcriptional regulator n=1 Tax=Enterococcus sp. BWR-S5 TaxID=2787714 RepID=UPI001922B8E1|nr:Rgg/GadR/MutR family transcriptional regulator [Enterococcus sp. BWR-S5]MBL1225480.1 helix-turn-helix domain-containing protein [Enterococcus sp. BWR-S5]